MSNARFLWEKSCVCSAAALSAEAAARRTGQFAFFDHAGAKGQGIHAERCNGGEYIKSALRFEIRQPHAVQTGADVISSASVNLALGRNVVCQGCSAGPLHKRRDGEDASDTIKLLWSRKS